MINKKQLYDNIPIVNKTEIERVFSELMAGFGIPKRNIHYESSYHKVTTLIDYCNSELHDEHFYVLDDDIRRKTLIGVWHGIWAGMMEGAKSGMRKGSLVGWLAGRNSAMNVSFLGAVGSIYIRAVLPAEKAVKSMLTYFTAFDIGYNEVLHCESNGFHTNTVSYIYYAIKSFIPKSFNAISKRDGYYGYTGEWYLLPVFWWYIAKAVWRAKALFKSFLELYKNGLFNFYFSSFGMVYCVNPGITVNKDGQLHNDKKEAVTWANGKKYWYLNGVRVKQKIVETPKEKLDPKIILTEENAEIRHEIVMKIGIDRICYKLNAKIIDKSSDGMYELLELYINYQCLPYLKMRNPSIDTYHIEGVGSECETVAEALAFRMRRVTDQDIIISENGQDWYQQGDVIVYPKGAKVLKPMPVILT